MALTKEKYLDKDRRRDILRLFKASDINEVRARISSDELTAIENARQRVALLEGLEVFDIAQNLREGGLLGF